MSQFSSNFNAVDRYLRRYRREYMAPLGLRGIHARLFVTRSDSALMSLSYAETHAVESLLSGPAASALGGSVLTRQP